MNEHLEAALEATREIEALKAAIAAWTTVRAQEVRAALADGATQTEVARILGVDQGTVSRMARSTDTYA